jgi:hypothetical protein
VLAANKYRNAQPLLLQAVDVASRPSAYGGAAWEPDGAEQLGPNAKYVSRAGGWPWGVFGGRYIDANLAQQGATPWATVAANGTGAVTYTLNLLPMVQHAMATNRWVAIKLRSSNGARSIAGRTAPVRNTIVYTYADGTSTTHDATCIAIAEASTPVPITVFDVMPLPVFAEWPKPNPAKTLTGATASIRVVAFFSGAADLQAYLLDPPVNVQPNTGSGAGLAMQAGAYDAGLGAVPGIQVSHRFEDGRPASDFLHWQLADGKFKEAAFNPVIWGGANDPTKWPNTVAGRWLVPSGADGRTQNVSISSSAQLTAAGVTPPGPGLGALTVSIPDQQVPAGGAIDNNGTFGGECLLFVPESAFGRQTEVFWRYWLWIQSPIDSAPARRREYIRGGIAGNWEDRGGKFGIGVDCSGSYGGQRGSGGGGGGFGYVLRNAWRSPTPGADGPDNGGLMFGQHIVDDWNNDNNPPGYRYGYPDAGQWDIAEERNGQQGGRGAVLYPGRWIEIEGQFKRNTTAADGSWQPDGILRAWVDGVLVWEKTNMVFAVLPAQTFPYDPSKLRPVRDLGIKGLILNVFHGGQSPSSQAYTFHHALIAQSSIGRIGSVRTSGTAPLTLPTWVPAASSTQANVTKLTTANGLLANNFVDTTAPNYATYWHHYLVDAYSGGTYNIDYGPWGATILFGGGHAACSDNTLAAVVYGATQWSFKRLIDPSPTFDMHSLAGGALPTFTASEIQDLNSYGNYNSTGTGPHNYGQQRVDGLTASQLVDGKPSSPHSYGIGAVRPAAYGGAAAGTYIVPAVCAANRDTAIITGSVTCYTAAFASTAVPSNTQAWQKRFTHATFPSASTNAYALQAAAPQASHTEFDPQTNRVIWQCRGKPLFFVDETAPQAVDGYKVSTGAELDATDMSGSATRLVLVPERNLLVWVYQKISTGVIGVKYAINGPNPSWVAASPPTIGSPLVPTRWSCATWCPDSPGGGRIIIGDLQNNSAQYAELLIPTVLTDPWVFELVNYSQPIPSTVSGGDNSSIYGRFKYVPKLSA